MAYIINGNTFITSSVQEYNFPALNVRECMVFEDASPQIGLTSGYVVGGGPGTCSTTEKFSFTSDGNASAIPGVLTQARNFTTGTFSSCVSAYTGGGTASGPVYSNVIDKFPFATEGNSTDVGDLATGRRDSAGNGSSTAGYVSGGYGPSNGYNQSMEKIPYSSDGNSTNIGNLVSTCATGVRGNSSTTCGYISGGYKVPPFPITACNNIRSFPFATDTDAVDTADLTQGRYRTATSGSLTHGYNAGGRNPSADVNTIDKFSYATNSNATDVGDLTATTKAGAGTSSETHGYVAGGDSIAQCIQKYPFASDTNASCIGSLATNRSNVGGAQV